MAVGVAVVEDMNGVVCIDQGWSGSVFVEGEAARSGLHEPRGRCCPPMNGPRVSDAHGGGFREVHVGDPVTDMRGVTR